MKATWALAVPVLLLGGPARAADRPNIILMLADDQGWHGYADGDGDTGNEEAYRFTDPNPVDLFGMAGRATAFMKKAKQAGQPFYVQLSWHALHAPGNALKATAAKYAHLGDAKRAE